MSWQAHNAITYHSKITAYGPLRLLHFLADGANAAGLVDPAPSQETMAQFLGCTTRAVRNHLAVLVASGELVCVRAGRGPGNSSAYRIFLAPTPPTTAPATAPAKIAAVSEAGETTAILAVLEVLTARIGEIEGRLASISANDANSGNSGNNSGNSGNNSGNSGNNSGKISANSGNGAVEYGAHDPGSINRSIRSKEGPPRARACWLDFFKANKIPLPKTEGEWEIVARPGITSWLLATGQWPGWDTLAYLDTRLGNEPSRESLAAAWTMWRAAGYRATNVVGILEWYENLCQNPDWRPGPPVGRQAAGGGTMATDYLEINPLTPTKWSL